MTIPNHQGKRKHMSGDQMMGFAPSEPLETVFFRRQGFMAMAEEAVEQRGVMKPGMADLISMLVEAPSDGARDELMAAYLLGRGLSPLANVEPQHKRRPTTEEWLSLADFHRIAKTLEEEISLDLVTRGFGGLSRHVNNWGHPGAVIHTASREALISADALVALRERDLRGGKGTLDDVTRIGGKTAEALRPILAQL